MPVRSRRAWPALRITLRLIEPERAQGLRFRLDFPAAATTAGQISRPSSLTPLAHVCFTSIATSPPNLWTHTLRAQRSRHVKVCELGLVCGGAAEKVRDPSGSDLLLVCRQRQTFSGSSLVTAKIVHRHLCGHEGALAAKVGERTAQIVQHAELDPLAGLAAATPKLADSTKSAAENTDLNRIPNPPSLIFVR